MDSLLTFMSHSSDALIWVIAFGFWKIDRRLLMLEGEHKIIMAHFNKIERGLHLPLNGES